MRQESDAQKLAIKRFFKRKPWIRRHNRKLGKLKKKLRTPAWANTKEIELLYRACPAGWHLDHIIPLNSSLVCGLHVASNLQLLPAKLNLEKSNKFEVVVGYDPEQVWIYAPWTKEEG